jgi:sodium ion-translocating decarboxylase beta subunit
VVWLMDGFFEVFLRFISVTGLANITPGQILLIGIGLILLSLGLSKIFEPLLLVPIGFGVILANIPLAGVMEQGGLLWWFYRYGVMTELIPCLIFLGIGAMLNFDALISNPLEAFLIGAAAEVGTFAAMIAATAVGFTLAEACSIGIIGGADGPLILYVTTKLAPDMLGPIAVAGYSYMSLVPIIQPPIIYALTTKRERQTVMDPLKIRRISRREKLLFIIVTTVVVCFLLPPATPLMGSLMFGNLLKESGVVDRLLRTSQNELLSLTTMFLGLSVGASMLAETVLQPKVLLVFGLGILAFAVSTTGGLLMGKFLYFATGGKTNPLLGSAGVSAVPISARVSQKIAQKEKPGNFILMHAMGPNVAGVISSSVAAAVFVSLTGL